MAKAIGTWLGKKTAESAWAQLRRYFGPGPLVRAIESALKSDPTVATICSPLPVVDRDRFTPDRIEQLLRAAIEGDIEKFSGYLITEQLIDLPPYPTTGRSNDEVWKCIANAVVDATAHVVLHDDELYRQFTVYLSESGRDDHQQLLVEIHDIQSQLERHLALLGSISEHMEDVSGRLYDVRGEERISANAQIRAINLLSENNAELEQQLREHLNKPSLGA